MIMSIATPAFLPFLFPSPYFQFICILCPMVSCRQHIVGSCFFIQSATLCLLNGAFSPLKFKVITDEYVFIAILNFVFKLILCFLFIPFLFGTLDNGWPLPVSVVSQDPQRSITYSNMHSYWKKGLTPPPSLLFAQSILQALEMAG